MTELRIGDQLIRFDREATVSAYSRVPQGDANRCTCAPCSNFALLRDSAYPDAFRNFLEELGIDPAKEGEVFHYGPEGDLQLYGGWFYFVVELVEPGTRLSNAGNEFHYRITQTFPRPPAEFGDTVSAVEFTILVTWLLEEPCDSPANATMLKVEEMMNRYPNALRALANRKQ
ncbi:MAG TPA: hypothetical protein VIL63_11760 [Terriglobales bacterium]